MWIECKYLTSLGKFIDSDIKYRDFGRLENSEAVWTFIVCLAAVRLSPRCVSHVEQVSTFNFTTHFHARSQLEHIKDRSNPICLRFCIEFASSLLVSVFLSLIHSWSRFWLPAHQCDHVTSHFFYIVIAQRVALTVASSVVGCTTSRSIEAHVRTTGSESTWARATPRYQPAKVYCIIHNRMEIVSDNVWRLASVFDLDDCKEIRNKTRAVEKEKKNFQKSFQTFLCISLSTWAGERVGERWLMTHSVGTAFNTYQVVYFN